MTSIPWRRGAVAGIVAGIVFVMVEMMLVIAVEGGSPWGPPRMMAAIALGRDVLPPPATFDAGIVMVGMMIHMVLSAALGVVFAAFAGVMKLPRPMAIVAGAAFGLLVYLVDFYGFTAMFPWFAMARGWMTIVSHLLFGAVIGALVGGHAAATVPA